MQPTLPGTQCQPFLVPWLHPGGWDALRQPVFLPTLAKPGGFPANGPCPPGPLANAAGEAAIVNASAAAIAKIFEFPITVSSPLSFTAQWINGERQQTFPVMVGDRLIASMNSKLSRQTTIDDAANDFVRNR